MNGARATSDSDSILQGIERVTERAGLATALEPGTATSGSVLWMFKPGKISLRELFIMKTKVKHKGILDLSRMNSGGV